MNDEPRADPDAADGTASGTEPTPTTAPDEASGPGFRAGLARAVIRSRRTAASVVWLGAVLAALCLSVGALLIALDADRHDDVVKLVLRGAGAIDGPFGQLFHFHQRTPAGRLVTDDAKDHLTNWGLAALAYLALGRIADRVVRP